MLHALIELALFSAKALIILIFILIILVAFFALLARGKNKLKGRLHIKSVNKKLEENKETIFLETLNKKEFKHFLKGQKAAEKALHKLTTPVKNVYVINFHGDIKASAVENLREEITAILTIATPKDEVVIRVESGGGVVHGYGLAAAQLMRIRAQNIPLVVCVDKIAASGGYLMACVANKILAAPFAIIGSIGVIIQMPNFHRLLKDKHIDFEQLTAGEFKRTITLFGRNTQEGREKLKEEIEAVHAIFKGLIVEHRPQVDIQEVATGEHWLGQQAIQLKLVDELKTSDDYILECSKVARVYEIGYEVKRSFMSKLTGSASSLQEKYQSPYQTMLQKLRDREDNVRN